jgi:Ribonuclease G/E
MAGWRITCDRSGGFVRAALWQGKVLSDLYVDSLEHPDMTGALVRARAVRVTSGGQKIWFDCGLAQTLYVEGAKTVRAGDLCTLSIRTTRGQGKGWSAALVKGYEEQQALGLVAPPPPVWARALADAPAGGKGTLAIEDREDYRLCQALLAQTSGPVRLEDFSREKVHPELDEMIEALRASRVPLSGGAELVLQPTEALVAIDVNGGEAANPTAVNLLAVRELARQVRLRNLSGIIVMDALKMPVRADQSKVMNALERAVEGDPAGVRSFGLSKLGLLELTRTRRGPALHEVMGG